MMTEPCQTGDEWDWGAVDLGDEELKPQTAMGEADGAESVPLVPIGSDTSLRVRVDLGVLEPITGNVSLLDYRLKTMPPFLFRRLVCVKESRLVARPLLRFTTCFTTVQGWCRRTTASLNHGVVLRRGAARELLSKLSPRMIKRH